MKDHSVVAEFNVVAFGASAAKLKIPLAPSTQILQCQKLQRF